MTIHSFEQLQARYLAGDTLSNDEATFLLRQLERNPDERHGLLVDQAIDNQLRCLGRINEDDSAEQFIQETLQRAVALQRHGDRLEIVPIVQKTGRRSSQWFFIPAGICAAALVLVGIATTWFSTSGRSQGDFGFAQLTNLENLSWELVDDERRRLSVSSGSGEILFENGTLARFSAPAVIELKTPGSLFVKSGSVAIRVPPAAVGFTVETPIARIVDLGTQFDVDVGDAGQTETRVRTGAVTFESLSRGINQSHPIRLTADGMNRASATESELSRGVRSVITTASGSQGQFYGAIHAAGNTAEFKSRREFDDFQNRLRSSVQSDSSPFREKPNAIAETAESGGASPLKDKSGGSGDLRRSSGGKAQEMLIDQIRSMQELNQGNPQMQELLEGMMLQIEEVQKKTSD